MHASASLNESSPDLYMTHAERDRENISIKRLAHLSVARSSEVHEAGTEYQVGSGIREFFQCRSSVLAFFFDKDM